MYISLKAVPVVSIYKAIPTEAARQFPATTLANALGPFETFATQLHELPTQESQMRQG